MTNIIFIALSEVSAGELTIAYQFGKRLPFNNYKVSFIINEKYKSLVDEAYHSNLCCVTNKSTMIYNSRKITNFIKEFDPKYIVISDPYTLEYSYSWSGLRFSDVKLLNIPIIGVDEYEYASTGYSIDYYAGINQRLPGLLEQCDYILRDCPINTKRTGEKNVYNFSLYNKEPKINEIDKCKIKESLNIQEDEKVIFYATSLWETMNSYNLSAITKLNFWIPILLQNYIKLLGKKITLIHVGPCEWDIIKNDKLHYLHFNSLQTNIFDQYLFVSDLFVTFNIVSVTLSKAVFLNVTSLVFQNDKIINFKNLEKRVEEMPDWYKEMAEDLKVVYPFKASTFGWYRFLSSVIKNNEYIKTFKTVQAFKLSEVIKTLNDLLYNEEEINKIKENSFNYKKEILSLPTPEEILIDIARSDE